VPKTAAGFVKDLNGIKRSGNSQAMVTYLRNIPVKQIEAYFKRTELESETLSDILETLTHSTDSKENCIWAASFMQALAKADNFELTISFAEDADKRRIEQILK
jgi:hypothetical protein